MSYKEYYPARAADDLNASYNEKDLDEMSVDICISQSLSKGTKITTANYSYDADYDDDGNICSTIDVDNDTIKDEYNEQHITPIDIITKCKELALEKLESKLSKEEVKYLKWLIKECDGWDTDETEIVKD